VVQKVESVQHSLNYLPGFLYSGIDNLVQKNFSNRRDLYLYVFHFKVFSRLVYKYPIQDLCNLYKDILEYSEMHTRNAKIQFMDDYLKAEFI
jgi:hypothetical protein